MVELGAKKLYVEHESGPERLNQTLAPFMRESFFERTWMLLSAAVFLTIVTALAGIVNWFFQSQHCRSAGIYIELAAADRSTTLENEESSRNRRLLDGGVRHAIDS
jgi:hypothetical protein